MAFLAVKRVRPFDFGGQNLKHGPSEGGNSNGKIPDAATSLAGGHLSGIVYVVDDDASFRTAVQRLLKKAGYRVVTYASAEQFLEQRPDENETGCILLDLRMPGLSGPALHSRLLELGSSLPILFLSGYLDVSATVTAIKAGADDFLTKPLESDKLLQAIEQALARHRAALEARRQSDILRGRLATLTPRERQVFLLVVRGKTNKQAAHELGASERTIKAHRQRVMEKLGAASLAELVLIGERFARGQ